MYEGLKDEYYICLKIKSNLNLNKVFTLIDTVQVLYFMRGLGTFIGELLTPVTDV